MPLTQVTTGLIADQAVTPAKLANSGYELGMRNAVINGCCRVAQRGSVSATNNAYTYGGADRIMAYPNSFTTFSGTVTQVTGTATASGVAQALTSVTTTGTGSIIFATRLEAKDCARFNGKTITISAKMYHEVTGGLGGAIQLYKANAADNFSGVTQINTTVNVGTIPLNVFTQVSASFTLGATDASNGLMIFWQFQSVGAVTGKTFAIGDLQMEVGATATPFDCRPIGTELALCQRYYEAGTAYVTTYSNGTNAILSSHQFKVTKRANPTLTLNSSDNIVNWTSPILSVEDTQSMCLTQGGVSAAGFSRCRFIFTIAAEL